MWLVRKINSRVYLNEHSGELVDIQDNGINISVCEDTTQVLIKVLKYRPEFADKITRTIINMRKDRTRKLVISFMEYIHMENFTNDDGDYGVAIFVNDECIVKFFDYCIIGNKGNKDLIFMLYEYNLHQVVSSAN